MIQHWSLYQLVFLEENYEHMSNAHIGEVIGKTRIQVAWQMIRQGWRRSAIKHWSDADLEFMRTHAHLGEPGLAKAMGVRQQKIRTALRNHGIRTGNKTQFKKGINPWNAGRHVRMSPGTEFKKGMLPHNTKHDGYIGIRKDKTGRPYKVIRLSLGKWETYNRYVWKQHHGAIPKGMLVIHKDGDALNCQIDNLELMTRKANVMRNRNDEKRKATLAELWENGSRYENDEWIAKMLAPGDTHAQRELLKHPHLIEVKRQQLLLKRTIKQAQV
jgi:hypothetical protein